jgi:hypothetical protein
MFKSSIVLYFEYRFLNSIDVNLYFWDSEMILSLYRGGYFLSTVNLLHTKLSFTAALYLKVLFGSQIDLSGELFLDYGIEIAIVRFLNFWR